MGTAFSYLRFSEPQQARGDTIRRQTANREAWLKAHPKVALDTSLRMTDAGRSAFRRKNWDTYALAEFVGHVKTGRVEPGSYLLVENLDRLSREDAGEATELFLSIVNKGVVIVQLSPVVMEFRRPVNVQSLMFAIVELSRGHSESAMKSERLGSAWANKRRRARERIVTRRLPWWVCVEGDDPETPPGDRRPIREGDRLALVPHKAEVFRRVYRMALDGLGLRRIAQAMDESGTPPPGLASYGGRPVRWDVTLVRHILTTRTAIGEYQPCTSRGGPRRPDGPPIPDYFPAVVSEQEFYAVQSALRTRARCGRGRRGRHVNLLAGLLRDARDGGSLTYAHRADRPVSIVPAGVRRGGAAWVSFPAVPLEEALTARLREVGAADVFPESGGGGRRLAAAAAMLAETEDLIAKWRAKMDAPDLVDTVAQKLIELEARRRAQAADLADAKRHTAAPLSEAWGELRTLFDLLASDGSPEMRERVRSALRRSIDAVYCLFVGGGRFRLAAVRVQFRGADTHRDYLIMAEAGRFNGTTGRPASCGAGDFAEAVKAGQLDLRRPADARRAEKMIRALTTGELAALAALLSPIA